ncbi:MAG: endonuclease domain-containing protein [Gammaproteobacteria bacterium]|nr:DNA (cytosine-5-)-methyltransferase [Gammaproteobacteria bacterium]
MRNKRLQRYARKMRRHPSDAERRLWYYLRRKQLQGFRFRRQVPIGPYIVDFYCIEARLAIEIDGSQHVRRREYDHGRDSYLLRRGVRVLRFWNNEVLQNLAGVVEVIGRELQLPPPCPSPASRGRDSRHFIRKAGEATIGSPPTSGGKHR